MTHRGCATPKVPQHIQNTAQGLAQVFLQASSSFSLVCSWSLGFRKSCSSTEIRRFGRCGYASNVLGDLGLSRGGPCRAVTSELDPGLWILPDGPGLEKSQSSWSEMLSQDRGGT